MKRRRATTRGIDYKKLAGIRTNIRRSKEETEESVAKAKQGAGKDVEKAAEVVK
jgi:hypothetical protein